MRCRSPSKSPFVSPKGWTAGLFGYYSAISVQPDLFSTLEMPRDIKNSTNRNFKAYFGQKEQRDVLCCLLVLLVDQKI